MCRSVQRSAQRYMEGCVEVHGDVWRVHGGALKCIEVCRGPQRCMEVHRCVQRCVEGCTEVCGDTWSFREVHRGV